MTTEHAELMDAAQDMLLFGKHEGECVLSANVCKLHAAAFNRRANRLTAALARARAAQPIVG